MQIVSSNARPRRAAYSVAQCAALCGISRARLYNHIAAGVMPPPVYCLFTRRPLYTADLAAICVRVKETGIGVNGRYVVFYDRHSQPRDAMPTATTSRSRKSSTAPEGLTQEMLETLKAMGVTAKENDLLAAISRQCPSGVTETTFEADLRAVFDAVRCREVA